MRRALGDLVRHRWRPGFCPICRQATAFVHYGPWERDNYRCLRCYSLPRWRALVVELERAFPEWPDLRVHEFAPGGAASNYLSSGRQYTRSHYWPDVRPGEERDGVRCEDLHALTFEDDSLDLVVTQDVLEHLLQPEKALAEVHRVLRPGGAHLLTVPIFDRPFTVVRARRSSTGAVEHVLPPDYHGDPVNDRGVLVVREWGADIVGFIESVTSDAVERVQRPSAAHGVVGEMVDVLIVRKLSFVT